MTRHEAQGGAQLTTERLASLPAVFVLGRSACALDLLARAMYPRGMAKTEPSAEAIREVMRYLSSRGASKGGKARKAKLSPERRREIARKAARARWGKRESD